MTVIKDERDMKNALLELAGARAVQIFEEMLASGLYGATLPDVVGWALLKTAREFLVGEAREVREL